MPKLREDTAPEWTELYRAAESQGGYFTTAQAHEAGYSNPLIHYYVREGRLERVARGIYRLGQFPAGENEELIVAWLWSDREGVLSHETALALHELSDVLPDRIHLTLPESWKRRRLRVPTGTVLAYADLEPEDRAWHGPVPVTTPLRTLLDCVQAATSPELTLQARDEALERGLFSRQQLRRAATQAGVHDQLLEPRTNRRKPKR